ncbi:hypothetical protein M3Y95_00891200 [Aphelenchoides besseyi]|nr:hypothetical protein M3Y95_00891200 [Aphelenchoides besseyi]
MDIPIPAIDDHSHVQIVVRHLGRRNDKVFAEVLDRLSQIGPIEVCEDSRRVIRPIFVTTINSKLVEFGELQTHRKVFGLIGVTTAPTKSSEADAIAALGAARASYDQSKTEFHKTLVNSRCITFGRSSLCSQFFNTAELLSFEETDDSVDTLEANVCDLIRSIYFVLEARRVDVSYERADQPTCPLLGEEERYRIGTENRQTKIYRRKCVGRLRKQSADYAMLAGLPATALDLYQAAIDYLKSAGDLLWLAAAYEGWSSAAIAIYYGRTNRDMSNLDVSGSQKSSIQRTVSMTPDVMHGENERSQHSLGVSIGHQRYRSDESQRITSVPATTNLNVSYGNSGKSTPVFQSPGSNTSANLNQSGSSNKTTLKKALALLNLEKSRDIDHKEIIARLKLALENYERYTFVSYVEFECVIRVVNVYRLERMFIETENFLREHVGKYLSDTFTFFDNFIKSNICMIAANIYTLMGFKRKNAFYARLAVLFRLHVDDNEFRSEDDYRIVYPVLYRTLPGYGINETTNELASKMGYVSIQVKAIHEVYMSAQRAGLNEAAIRHLCYMLQTYFFHIESTNVIQMIDELKRLVHVQQTKNGRISLAKPLRIDECDVVLPPLQMNRFPMLSNFRIQPLASNLAPSVVFNNKIDDVFIYSPFQGRNQVKDIIWVVGTGCQVSVCVQNLLPTELVVKSLTLHAEGCEFEAVPIRLNLAAATTSTIQTTTTTKKLFLLNSTAPSTRPPVETLTTTAGDVALLGVPRAPGVLKLTGYSCEVFDVENVCELRDMGEIRPITVRVIQSLPRLQVTTTLKRAPVVDEDVTAGGVAEATVFSGQTFFHSMKIQNTDSELAIRQVRIQIDQPQVYGGPRLLEILDLDDRAKTDKKTNVSTWTLDGLKANEQRQIRFRIFGIDPAATAEDPKSQATGEERQVFVRKQPPKQFLGDDLLSELDEDPFSAEEESQHSRSSDSKRKRPVSVSPVVSASAHPNPGDTTTFTDDSLLANQSIGDFEDEDEPDEVRRLLSRTNSAISDQVPTPTSLTSAARLARRSTHDLIPYTGRLLCADFVVTYVADVETENGETYERTETLRLAITIVPALTVVEWHMIAGDTPSNRFVVVDVTNLSDSDAELTFGPDQRTIAVQPRELCRVPLLCPCSTQIQSSEFQQAAQRASSMMQKQEMEQLRRRLEKHVAQHLKISWRINALQLEGLVPVGPLLASVSFLKQLVVPSISVCVEINNRPYLSEDDISVGIGEMQRIHVQLIYAASETRSLNGEFSLRCFQDLQNGSPLLERMDSVVVCGVQRQPFHLSPDSSQPPPLPPNSPPFTSFASASPPPNHREPLTFEADFNFLFRTEGVYKIRPQVTARRSDGPVPKDELFVPTISFKVQTKLS